MTTDRPKIDEAQIDEAIARLDEQDREILKLRYTNRRSFKQIAKLLNVGERVVSQRHGVAMIRLTKLLRAARLGDG